VAIPYRPKTCFVCLSTCVMLGNTRCQSTSAHCLSSQLRLCVTARPLPPYMPTCRRRCVRASGRPTGIWSWLRRMYTHMHTWGAKPKRGRANTCRRAFTSPEGGLKRAFERREDDPIENENWSQCAKKQQRKIDGNTNCTAKEKPRGHKELYTVQCTCTVHMMEH
jgi:hypothetical protein